VAAADAPFTGVELLLDWIAALRQGDIDRIADLLDPEVAWYGVAPDLVCVGREAVLEVLCEQIPMRLEAEAIEFVSAPPRFVMGTRSRHLPDPPDVRLAGQVYNVFEHRDRRFVSIRDFARRDDALRCAGADAAAEWR
jgi:hypothetical protein